MVLLQFFSVYALLFTTILSFVDPDEMCLRASISVYNGWDGQAETPRAAFEKPWRLCSLVNERIIRQPQIREQALEGFSRKDYKVL